MCLSAAVSRSGPHNPRSWSPGARRRPKHRPVGDGARFADLPAFDRTVLLAHPIAGRDGVGYRTVTVTHWLRSSVPSAPIARNSTSNRTPERNGAPRCTSKCAAPDPSADVTTGSTAHLRSGRRDARGLAGHWVWASCQACRISGRSRPRSGTLSPVPRAQARSSAVDGSEAAGSGELAGSPRSMPKRSLIACSVLAQVCAAAR